MDRNRKTQTFLYRSDDGIQVRTGKKERKIKFLSKGTHTLSVTSLKAFINATVILLQSNSDSFTLQDHAHKHGEVTIPEF